MVKKMNINNRNTNIAYTPKVETEYQTLCKKHRELSRKIKLLELTPEKDFQGALLPEDLPYNIPFSAKAWTCALYNEVASHNFLPSQKKEIFETIQEIRSDYERQQQHQSLPLFEKIFDTVCILEDHSVLKLKKIALAHKWISNATKLAEYQRYLKEMDNFPSVFHGFNKK